jgi:hypothetical protein
MNASAPIAIAANATPRNQDGNMSTNSAGTAWFGSLTFTPAAIAMKPSSAINPSRNVQAGSSDMLRLTTSCERELSTAVSACGYRNSANADPSASVA